MPVVTGVIDSYQVPTNARDVSKAFPLIKKEETPFFNLMPMPGVAENTKHFWWDDQRQIRGTALTAAYVSGANSLVVADSTGARAGMLAELNGKVYKITAVPDGTHLSTVVADGSGDAAQASGSKVNFLGTAAKEGEDYVDTVFTPEVERFNVTQIFNDFVKITGTEQAVSREVNDGDYLVRVSTKKLELLYLQMARAIWTNPRVTPVDKTTPRILGGVDWFLAQYGANTAATWSVANFDSWLLDLDKAGANLAELWMNPVDLQRFSALNSTQVQMRREDTSRGSYADKYISAYGHELKLNTDMNAPVGKIRAIRVNQFALLPLKGRQFQVQTLDKTGDSDKRMLVGEYTMEVRNAATMGYFIPS